MLFVILEHHLPSLDRPDHFDLMFSQPSGSLRTWSIRRKPDLPGRQEALSLADHREAYLTHEGTTRRSQGWVRRWSRGAFRPVYQRPDGWRMLVESPRLVGLMTLELVDGIWRYAFERRI